MSRSSSMGAVGARARSALGLTIATSLALIACQDEPHAIVGVSPPEAERYAQNATQAEQGPLQPAGGTISFAMNKWLDADGATKASVAGRFDTFTVTTSRPLSGVLGVEELTDLSADVVIDLGSVETELPLRNDNIERAYFEVSAFPSATFHVTNARPQGTGSAGRVLVDGELDLHGFAVALNDIGLDFTRSDAGWRVVTSAPIAIRSDDFGMPVAQLLSTCGHLGIDEFATLSVDLTVQHAD